jgi:hypothetical protein
MTNVHLANLDKAFALAHRASEDGRYSNKARAIFRAIAHQIWLSCGESRPTDGVLKALAGGPSAAALLIDSMKEDLA